MKTPLSLALLLALLVPACPGPKPPVVTPPALMRPVAVVVVHQGTPIAGAAVTLDDAPLPHQGQTNADGYVLFARVPATLSATQLRVEAEGYVTHDVHLDLEAGPQTLTVTLTAAEPPPPPLADVRDVRSNFCALTDPVTGKSVFTSFWPSQDAETRARWLQLALAAGDTHYVVSNVQGYGSMYPDHFAFLDGRMPEFNARLRELLKAGLRPVVFVHSGDSWPGADYFRRFIAAIDADLRAECLWVPGWEVVPGGWSTWQLCQATRALREALGGDALTGPHMAIHLGDGRLSFSSNPVEADDPFAGDEIASVRSWYGQQYSVYLYQSPIVRHEDPLDPDTEEGEWGRAHECLSRATGDRWHNAPDWFAGLPVRWRPVMFEANEEWYIRGTETRARMLQISAAALRMGWQGYGFGQAPAR